MNKLAAMQTLVWLDQLGSFSKVAACHHLSKAKVSKMISALESELNCQLVHRTTRQISFTPAGKLYLQQCNQIFAQLEYAEAQLKQKDTQIDGTLRINMPMSLGILTLSDLLADFSKQYPQVHLDLHFSDYSQDLVENGFDLGFRVSSKLQDSSYIASKICTFEHHLYAAPSYLQANGTPKNNQELKNHNCLIYALRHQKQSWPITGKQAMTGNVIANNGLALKRLAIRGMGICSLPSFFIQDEIAHNKLVKVLPTSTTHTSNLFAIYPKRQYQPKRVLACIEFAKQWFLENTYSEQSK